MEEITIIKNHGRVFKRIGHCLRCGACGCEKLQCLHFTWQDGLATCLIYNDRDNRKVCKECTEYFSKKHGKEVIIGHDTCKDFPDYPNIRVINTGVCGFKFEEIKED